MQREEGDKRVLPDQPRVYLVGAGPGDPGLLTLKGAQILERADVVLYDHLIDLGLLDLVPDHAEKIDAGKIRNHPRMTQAEIEATLIARAKSGNLVVRLKGGDPFLFGRGGEEAQALAAAGIPFAVVPGVSSSIAVPAYAGVPVTHRDHNSRLVILTAHDDPGKWDEADLQALTRPHQTLVVLMGVLYMGPLVGRLLKAGLSPETPVLLSHWGTTSRQECFQETLGTVSDFLARTGLSAPVTLVIGSVVALRPEVAWTHRFPLFGKTILLTRDRESGKELATALQSLGATVVTCPSIAITSRLSPGAEESLLHPEVFSWILFVSPNGVHSFFQHFRRLGKDCRSLAGVRLFSMGLATADALRKEGLFPDLLPETPHGPGVIEAFDRLRQSGIPDKPLLVVRGDRGSGLIPDGLRAIGFKAKEISVYENTVPDLPAYKKERISEMLSCRSIDLTVYYSPSALSGFLSLFPDRRNDILSLPSLAIGPTTRSALEENSAKNIAMASHPTLEGVADAVLDFLLPIRNNPGMSHP